MADKLGILEDKMEKSKWAPPKRVADRYEIRGEIGRGGMGVVYQGFDCTLQRNVALKFMDSDQIENREAVSRFQREALAAGKIGHENICDIRDRGDTEDGVPYIVMELLEGEPLSEVLERQGKVDQDRAVGITIQMLSALEAAHQAKIIHRDLKPENIFLAQRPNGPERVKLVDFGISKFQSETDELHLTKTGFVMGSPYYMSPEQARGRSDVDHTSDIWSVGVVLFEMLTGTLPFDGNNYNEVMVNIVSGEPADPMRLNPAISRELSDVVLRALAAETAYRFSSAAEFASALGEASGRQDLVELTFGGLLPPPSPFRKPPRRHQHRRLLLWVGIPASVVVVLAGVVVGWWLSAAPPTPPPSPPDAAPVEPPARPAKAADAGPPAPPEPPPPPPTVEVTAPDEPDATPAEQAPAKAPPDAGAGGKVPRKRGHSSPPQRGQNGGTAPEKAPPMEILPPPPRRE